MRPFVFMIPLQFLPIISQPGENLGMGKLQETKNNKDGGVFQERQKYISD